MRSIVSILITASFVLLPLQASRALVAGSFNIRYDNPGDVEKGNSWQQRLPVIAGLIRFHGFDILGTQEAYHHQLTGLQDLLPAYAHTGVGRDDGKEAGEHAAIFYRKDKFTLEDSGTFWLSETPEKPGKGWDADLPRICTWAKLRRAGDGGSIFVFNTHFDHRGVQARLESARLIVTRIREIAKEEPVILTGDFNVDQTSESYRSLHDSGVLADSFETAAERYALNGTANAFRPDTRTESRIDHVFHTRQLKPVRYGILTDTYRTAVADAPETQSGNFPGEVKFRNFQARMPSDHFPVLVEFE
ncbi:MAG: endonuclease/exonuclease/phosphatase family protein [Verrucomicrobiaceae bacterium]|nr:MAG: endonuclease/exonuclease/phosphatase family protein [Verrucomicrobiaceae bacterium]